jgi:phosphopantothenoylcysteine decarboxylase/phosphopantothenate--cysteine ligase
MRYRRKSHRVRSRRRRQLRFLVTAGGTREYIDPVRFITNASSGKMGYALAAAALKAGHKVTLISTLKDRAVPKGAEVFYVETASDMFAAVRKRFGKCDCLIMAAAVADYTPVKTATTKIKKQNSALTIKLKPTVDILRWAADHKKKGQRIVGFALEDKAVRTRALRKLKDKNLDVIVANSPSCINADRADFQIRTPGSDWRVLANVTKAGAAGEIIRLACNVLRDA